MSGFVKQVNNKANTLDNILTVMAEFKFSKAQAIAIVGGEGKLLDLIAKGKVDCEKTSDAPNAKWYFNAAQILSHCRNTRPTRNR